jgi:hypothetical protein
VRARRQRADERRRELVRLVEIVDQHQARTGARHQLEVGAQRPLQAGARLRGLNAGCRGLFPVELAEQRTLAGRQELEDVGRRTPQTAVQLAGDVRAGRGT